MKRRVLIFLMLLTGHLVYGGNKEKALPKASFGAEWSYMATFFSAYHYNFFDPDGFRVNEKGSAASYFTNGEVCLHVGYNVNALWNIALYAGYAGAGNFHAVIPISVRATRFFGKSHMTDRWFAFCDIGSGISVKNTPQEIYTGKLGGGYRLSLSRHTKIDFIAALRTLYLHTDIEYFGDTLSDDLVNRNDGYVSSLCFGISLTF